MRAAIVGTALICDADNAAPSIGATEQQHVTVKIARRVRAHAWEIWRAPNAPAHIRTATNPEVTRHHSCAHVVA